MIIDRFYKSLVTGGILAVSPVETSGVLNPRFIKVNFSGFFIFQKGLKITQEKNDSTCSISTFNKH